MIGTTFTAAVFAVSALVSYQRMGLDSRSRCEFMSVRSDHSRAPAAQFPLGSWSPLFEPMAMIQHLETVTVWWPSE